MQIHGFQKTTLLDFPGKVACTVFTGGCNFRCPFCHNGNLVLAPADVPMIGQETVLAQLKKRKGILDGICITGGEPMLQADLPDFIRRVKALGLSVKLDTNGYQPDILETLVRDGLLDYVAMDIKQCPEKYNFISQVRGFDFGKIKASVAFLMDGTLPFEFRTTVVKELHEKEDFEAIGAWLKGAPAYFLQPYRDSEQVILPGFSSYSDAELVQIQDILLSRIPNTVIRGMT